MVCKYRKKLLATLCKDTKQIMFEVSQLSDFKIDTMEADKDHLHLLIDLEPKISVSAVVNRLKSISTNRLWKKHKVFLKQHYWAEKTFWSDGYFACSVGDANIKTIENYIKTQG